jgi:hypothetical protein
MPSASVPPPAIDALPAEQSRDPDVWVVVAALATIAFSALQILLYSFGRDQSIYAMVGSGLLRGELPYRDVWDFKPPGIFFVYALAFAVFGQSMLAPRILEVLGLVGLVFAFRRLGLVLFGSRTAGLVGAAVAALVHAELEFWHTGQPETFGAYFIVAALVLTCHDYAHPRVRIWGWVGIGLAFGMAFLLKPPLGGGAPVCAAYIVRQLAAGKPSRLKLMSPLAVIGGASLLPILVCAGWFWWQGGWAELYWTLMEFTPGYTALGWHGQSAPAMFYTATEEAFFEHSALIGVGFIAAIAMRPVHSREREGIFLICGVVSVQLAGIAMQGKFFLYHYAATLPILGLIAGLGWYKLWRRCLGQGSGAWLAFVAFILVVGSMRRAVYDVPLGFWQRSLARLEYLMGSRSLRSRAALDEKLYRAADFSLNADRRVAQEVMDRTSVEEPIFVWGFEPSIYWLSERAPASRFIYNVAQRSPWQREQARALLVKDLERRPPEIVVVQHSDVFPAVTGSELDSAAALYDFEPLRQMLSSEYQLVTKVEDFEIFQRRLPHEPTDTKDPR